MTIHCPFDCPLKRKLLGFSCHAACPSLWEPPVSKGERHCVRALTGHVRRPACWQSSDRGATLPTSGVNKEVGRGVTPDPAANALCIGQVREYHGDVTCKLPVAFQADTVTGLHFQTGWDSGEGSGHRLVSAWHRFLPLQLTTASLKP